MAQRRGKFILFGILHSVGYWVGGGSSGAGVEQSAEIPNVGPEAWSVTPGPAALRKDTGRVQRIQGPTIRRLVESEGEVFGEVRKGLVLGGGAGGAGQAHLTVLEFTVKGSQKLSW